MTTANEDDDISDFDDSTEDFLSQRQIRRDPLDPIKEHDREREAGFSPRLELRLERRMQRLLDRQNREIDTRIAQRLKEQTKELEQKIASAFPDGDLHGHRVAHEKQIKTANRWDELKAEFISKAFTGGMLAAAAFVGLLIWEWFKAEVKK